MIEKRSILPNVFLVFYRETEIESYEISDRKTLLSPSYIYLLEQGLVRFLQKQAYSVANGRSLEII